MIESLRDFMGTRVTFFAGAMREQFGMTKVISFIAAFGGVNGVVEAAVCFVIGLRYRRR